MRALIIPNRISITPRYPMLGFTIQAPGGDVMAEVTLATDLALFADKSRRSADNFFSTASMGPLHVKGGEAVYVVPAEVLARFVGKQRIYFALAIKPADGSGEWQVQDMPDEGSIFISIEGLTGRGVRRVRAFPDRSRSRAPGYGANGDAAVTWAGDTVARSVIKPGTNTPSPQPAPGAHPNAAPSHATFVPSGPIPAPMPYNDGFGELPPLPTEDGPPPTANRLDEELTDETDADDAPDDADEDENIAEELGVHTLGAGGMRFAERVAAETPEVSDMGRVLRIGFEATMAMNPAFATTVALARLANARGLSVGLGVAVSAGFAAGGSLGAGIILGKDGDLGVYGLGELDLGALFGASATIQMTVLNGGIDAFSGITMVAGFSGGEGIVAGGVAIFDADSNFLGTTFEIGLGIGSPLETYAGVQRGVSHSFGYATAFGAAPVMAEPMLRDSDADARRYVPRWRHLLTWRAPSAIRSEVSRRGFSVQTFAGADGDLNIDKLEVRVDRLPRGQSANALIRHIRENLPRFVNPTLTEFKFMSGADRTKWSSSSPKGTVFKLEIPGDNAAVVASTVTARKWRFTTIETPATGTHPVSGHREFGIREVGDGFIIYTKGADRFTYPSALGALETPAFAMGERLWRSFQEKVADHINRNGGSARVLTPFRRHFAWDEAQRALRGGASRGQSQTFGAGSDPYSVEVKYRMFIPSPAINGPPLMNDFGGDDRGFAYSGGTSRGEVVARVKFTNDMGIDNIRINKRAWGESKGYDSDDTRIVSGKPDWWLGLRDGASPVERETLRATADNLTVVSRTTGRRAIEAAAENASVVTVRAEGNLPLVPMSPDIDSDIALFFRKRGGQIQVKAVGSHDGFPCHELYVNGKTIHRYDPVRAGNTPNALLGTSDTSVRTDWVNVASVSGAAQSLSINESFSLNWDDVQQVPQPTNLSCWAAAAAMVVGWRDKISLSPSTIAEIANRPVNQGLDINKFEDLAAGLGLTPVAGQSFTPQGFRDLLENNGPLWVSVALPNSIHAIVVTGMYSDEDGDLMVRITDPWDRIVGTPGSPGAHKSTHQTGSRYIMTWEAFEAEYARMGANTSATYQILHSGGTDGQTLNQGAQTPPGYAASLSNDVVSNASPKPAPAPTPPATAPAAAPVAVTISADDATIAPAQITPMSGPNGVPTEQRWHAAISEVLGAAHAAALVGVPALAAERQWTVAVGHDTPQGYGAAGVGVAPNGAIFRYGGNGASAAEPAMASAETRMLVTVAEGAPDLFSQWTRARAFSATNGVTGAVLLNGSELPLALAMRVAPGPAMAGDVQAIAAAVTEAFAPKPVSSSATPVNADVLPASSTPPTTPIAPQPAAAPGTPQLSPDALSALASVLNQVDAQSPTPTAVVPEMPVPPSGNGAAPTQPPHASHDQPNDGDFPPPGVEIHRSNVNRNGVQYDLLLMDGTVFPEMPPAVQTPLMPGSQVVLDDWPYLDGPSGRSKGGVVIDWSYGGGAVANVRTAPVAPAALDGWAIHVKTDVSAAPSEDTEAKLKLTVRTSFTKAGEAPRNALCCVILCGSGQHEVSHQEESPSAAQIAPQAALV